jgi:hypothetical protein
MAGMPCVNGPCCCAVPFTPIFRRIFEIAVLQQFGIQPAVGRIVDIFEKNANQFVADFLRLTGIDRHRRFHRLKPRKTHGIVFRLFIIKQSFISAQLCRLHQVVDSLPIHFKRIRIGRKVFLCIPVDIIILWFPVNQIR